MITINLRPGARRAVKRGAAFAGMGGRFKEMTSGVKDPWQMAAMAAWAVVVLGLGFFFITTSAKASSLEPQLVEARAEHDRYQNFLREKRREELSRDSILSQIGTISAIDRDRFVWPHILDEVNDALPDNTWLTEVTTLAGAGNNVIPGDAPPPNIRISGLTGDLANYTAFLRRLEASPWLVNVLPLQAQTVIQGNRPLTSFTIQATFSQADSSVVQTTPILESVVEE
jgi:Tfp pilus assembly protein PilN